MLPDYVPHEILLSIGSAVLGLLAGLIIVRIPAGGKKQVEEVEQPEDKLLVELPPVPTAAETSEPIDVNPRQLREVVENVQALTTDMRLDVSQHSTMVESINDDLQAISNFDDPVAVATVISRLVEANRHLDSRLNSAEARLQEQSQLLQSQRVEARTDALTGLSNRRVFDEEIQRLYEANRKSKRPVSLIMIDIDHFKKFNDTHGHLGGDACLKQVAQVVRSTVRNVGGIVSRYGGEEFAVLLPGMPLFDAKIASMRLTRAVARTEIEADGESLHVTISSGIAELNADADPQAWITRADQALYAAKRGGRNRGYWHDGQSAQEIPTKAAESKDHDEIEDLPLTDSPASFGENTAERDEFVRDLSRRLAMFQRRQQTISLMLVSIDPQAGHPAILHEHFPSMQTATKQIFQAVVRKMDHVCQMSDNLLGIILPTATADDASNVAERARRATTKLLFPTVPEPTRFSVSCGVTEALEGDEAEDMLERAASCIARAQQTGGDRVFILRHDGDWDSPHPWEETPAAAEA